MHTHRPTTAFLAILLLSAGPAAIVTAQSPMASPDASQAPIDTSTWTSYASDRYGFSIGHPADWVEVPADHTWSLPRTPTG